VLRGGLAVDPLAKKIQFTLATFQQSLTPIQFFQPFADRLLQPLHLVPKIRRLEICADHIDLCSPAVGVSSNGRTVLGALSHARGLAKIDLLTQACADKAAGVTDQ
jgi:hypothetical protein